MKIKEDILLKLLFGTKEQKEESLKYIKKEEINKIVKEKWKFEDAKRGKISYITEEYIK